MTAKEGSVFFPVVVATEILYRDGIFKLLWGPGRYDNPKIQYSALYSRRGRMERRTGCWSRPSPTATCGQRRISQGRVLRVAAIRDTKVKGQQRGILFL
jgi:hypothetical protein